MNGFQIATILNNIPVTKLLFQGIYTYDNVPKFLPNKNSIYVINTLSQYDSHDMGHWVVIVIKNNVLFFLDSMGNKPNFYGFNISNCFESFPRRKVVVFSRPVQNEFSLVCGAYVIVFAYIMCKYGKISFIKSKFGRNTCRNDIVVLKFLYKLIGFNNRCNDFLCSRTTFNRKCEKDCLCSSHN